jgi:cation diffusion facilitator family transporter
MTATPAQTSLEQISAGENARLTAWITTLSVATASVLLTMKAAVWLLSGSVAMLASMADSALDLVASVGTFAAVRYAVTPPDEEHRYGHGKAEAFASLLQAALVFTSAGLIGREAVVRLIHPAPVGAEGWAIAVMVASTFIVLGLIWAQGRVLAKTRSVAVAGDRAHYAADVASNIAALLGLAAARLTGDARWDAAAGVVVMLWLLWGAVGVFRESSHHLMDRELDERDRQRIIALALDDPKVFGVHQVRTRASGPYVHIQMHMDLEPDQSLDDAHKLVQAAEQRILRAFPAADVLIHPDPYGRAETHGEGFFDRNS